MYEEKFSLARISLKKDSSNSCKPSSTNGLKKVLQNNRVKSERKAGREKVHNRAAPPVRIAWSANLIPIVQHRLVVASRVKLQ